MSHAQQTQRLFRFIDNFEHSDDVVRLELLMLLLGFVQKRHRPDPACLVLILDNLDSVLPSAQFELLVEILRFQELAKVRTVVPLRRSTFEQLPNHAALSFGIISHLGPNVADVVKTRITTTLERWEQLPQLKALEPYHQDALKARLRFLASDIVSPNSGSEKVLWLAGASLRLGLYMFERVLINNVIAFDSDPQTRDEVLRCAIDGTDAVFDNNSRFVANLFVDPDTNQLSLICLRILQFVYEFGARPHLRRTRNLLSVLSAVNSTWRTDTVRKALNYLLAPKRPLLWVDGKTMYITGKHVVECDDVLYLTEAGDNYLRRLLFDLQYLQEMLAALEWEEGSGMPVAVNYGSIHARFDLLRRFLGTVMQRDLDEAKRFVDSRTKVDLIADLRVEFISQKIILRVSESMLAIYRSLSYRSMEALDACRAWLSTVITCANVEGGLEHRRFEGVIRGFELLIRELEHPRGPLIEER